MAGQCRLGAARKLGSLRRDCKSGQKCSRAHFDPIEPFDRLFASAG